MATREAPRSYVSLLFPDPALVLLQFLVYWKGQERRLILTVLGSINLKLEVHGILGVVLTFSSA